PLPFSLTRPPPAALSPLSLHDALPIFALLRAGLPRGPLGAGVRQVRLHRRPGPLQRAVGRGHAGAERRGGVAGRPAEHVAGDQRSEEHTSELQSLAYLVCRLLLEKKKT